MDRYKIAGDVSYKAKMSMRASDKAVKAVFDEITKCLVEGETIVLRKFGSFHIRNKKARMGRNPKNGNPAMISARTVAIFKSSNNFRELVDAGHKERENDKISQR